LVDSVLAARAIEAKYPDVAVTVADARFMKPLDEEMIRKLAIESDVMVTVEEGSKGGFGDHVLHFLSEDGLLDRGTLRVRTMVIPDIWIEAGPIKDQLDIAQLNEPHIAEKLESMIQSIRDYRPKRVIDVKAETIAAAKVRR
jgi:1-deoxy-D-xylulose-5-phosphate synthase